MYPRNAIQIYPTHSLSQEHISSASLFGASLGTPMLMRPYSTSPKDSKMFDRLSKAVDKSLQHCENLPSTKHVARVKYPLKDLTDKLNRNDDNDTSLTRRDPHNLLPLANPFERLQHVLEFMDVVDEATSILFLEELENELLGIIDTVDAMRQNASRFLKNRVVVHASRLHDLIEGFNITSTRLSGNNAQLDDIINNDTKSVMQDSMDANHRDFPQQVTPVSELNWNLSGASIELEGGGIANGNVGFDKQIINMSNCIFKVNGGSIGCNNISSNVLDRQMLLCLAQMGYLQQK